MKTYEIDMSGIMFTLASSKAVSMLPGTDECLIGDDIILHGVESVKEVKNEKDHQKRG